jgi:hypothetical protein
MTIRTKLYGAMVVTAAGLALVVGLGFWGMNRLDEHFGAARRAADDRSLALALKYDITDLNGWQTAYGYDSGVSRPIFLRSVAAFRRDDARARERLSSPAERLQLTRIRAAFNDFMRLDDDAFAAVQAGRDRRVRDILLGPEIRNFQRAALASDELATLEARRSDNENDRFVEARREIQRLMVIAALVAGLFVLILLVTANDLARLAERSVAAEDDGGDQPVGSL